MDVRGAFTNTVPIDAYRGAGKPEANYIIERLVDLAARRIGVEPAELRRRNLIASFPYRTAMGMTIDCGTFASNVDRALDAADAIGFAQRRAAAQARGMLRGIGVACFLETARGQPGEWAAVRFEGASPSRSARSRTDRDTRQASRRLRRTFWACRSRPSALCRRIRARSRADGAMAAHAPCTWAARRWCAPSTPCSRKGALWRRN
jgi:hypothetical protein